MIKMKQCVSKMVKIMEKRRTPVGKGQKVVLELETGTGKLVTCCRTVV